MVFAAAPITLAIKSAANAHNDAPNGDHDGEQNDTVSVTGTVTKFLYNDDESNDSDNHEANDTDDHEANDSDHNETEHGNMTRVCAFVIDNSTIVEFGPWWYWMYNGTNITDVVHIGDVVNVTGELEDEDDTSVLEAWHIANLTTGTELTIKEEGRPPWAGGPKGLGINPWPPSDEDD